MSVFLLCLFVTRNQDASSKISAAFAMIIAF
jgi:hypothetical protein